MIRWLAFALLLCGCAHKHAEEHSASAEIHETARIEQETHSITTVQRGPETITTTVEEFAPLPSVEASDIPRADTARGATPMGLQPPPTARVDMLPRAPILVKRTIIVDQRGPASTTIAAEAKGASTAAIAAEAEAHDKLRTSTSVGPSPLAWALIALALAGAGLAAWKLRRFVL